jgi:protein disulfide-isomerase A1
VSKAAFAEYAEIHRDDYLFGLSFDAAKVASVSAPAVVLYKTFDEGRNDLVGTVDVAKLGAFVSEHSVPLLDEISPDNFATYSDAGLPLAYIFVEASDPKRQEITKAIEPVAREHKGKVNFVWIDATKVSRQRTRPPAAGTDDIRCSSPTTPSLSTSPNPSGPRSPSKTCRL